MKVKGKRDEMVNIIKGWLALFLVLFVSAIPFALLIGPALLGFIISSKFLFLYLITNPILCFTGPNAES